MSRTDQKPKRPGAVELAEGDPRRGSVRPEVGSEMLEVVEPIEEEPGAEAFGVADQVAGGADPSPDDGAAVRLGPDRDDTGGGVPAPEPFILDQREGPFMVGSLWVGMGSGAGNILGERGFPKASLFISATRSRNIPLTLLSSSVSNFCKRPFRIRRRPWTVHS